MEAVHAATRLITRSCQQWNCAVRTQHHGEVEQVTIEELAENTFGVMARVERGETIEVTTRGRPIAHIVPISPPGEPNR